MLNLNRSLRAFFVSLFFHSPSRPKSKSNRYPVTRCQQLLRSQRPPAPTLALASLHELYTGIMEPSSAWSSPSALSRLDSFQFSSISSFIGTISTVSRHPSYAQGVRPPIADHGQSKVTYDVHILSLRNMMAFPQVSTSTVCARII